MDYSFFPTYYSILLFLKVLPIILFVLPIILFIVPTILIKYNVINLGTMIIRIYIIRAAGRGPRVPRLMELC